MRYEYGVDPETLSDKDWTKLCGEYSFVKELESVRFKDNLKSVLYELATAIYGKK